MGTSSSDETVKVFEGHKGSLCQRENINANLDWTLGIIFSLTPADIVYNPVAVGHRWALGYTDICDKERG